MCKDILLGEMPERENREKTGEGWENHPKADPQGKRGRKFGWNHPRWLCCQRKVQKYSREGYKPKVELVQEPHVSQEQTCLRISARLGLSLRGSASLLLGWEQPLGSMDSVQMSNSPRSMMLCVVGEPERYMLVTAIKGIITSLWALQWC